MRAVIQRVCCASVAVAGQVTAEIDKGLLILLGIAASDDLESVDGLANKISKLRVFNDAQGVMNKSIRDGNAELLVVSQFILCASAKKGNRLSYSRAAKPEAARHLYADFVGKLAAESGRPVQTGIFGADMQLTLVNDGPVTLVIDTKMRDEGAFRVTANRG